MTTYLRIGGIGFRIESEVDLRIEDAVRSFLSDTPGENPVEIRVRRDAPAVPAPTGPMVGEDPLLEYYQETDALLCLSKGGSGRSLSTAVCGPDCREITLYLYGADAPLLSSLGNLLRLIPMKTILQRHGAMFIHGSQAAYQGRGILFTAASGTGKTTQARLWQTHRGARIICNDRVLIRRGQTYGYPVDGSEPVFSSETFPLGAVVLLGQAPENRIRRLKAREALSRLMRQMICDYWQPQAAAAAAEQILEVIQKYPVYLLECTPDARAVACLEQQLIKDGVLQDENCS